MLAHSPPLPLVINYTEDVPGIAVEDEEGATLALKKRHRIRRVRLFMPFVTRQKLFAVIEGDYPVLEDLIIWSWTRDDMTLVMFPETFHAPHLRHLALVGFTLPIGSRLLTTAVRLVTLCLVISHPSVYFPPNTLLQWLSFMPQLETLNIKFLFLPNRDEERQLTHPPVMTPVTLPNLHDFSFQGHSTYLDALVLRITPCPEKLYICFPNQRTFPVPRLLRFMNTTWNLNFESTKFKFSRFRASMVVYPRGEAEKYALSVIVSGGELDWLVSYMAQISNLFSQIFSGVEHLALELEDEEDNWTSEEPLLEYNGLHRIEWRQLLSSFRNVKTLRIANVFVKGVSHCLGLDGGGLPLDLLPELQEFTYSGRGKSGYVPVLTSFIDARQKAGRPITLTRC
jgi:hypothetical protein